MTKIIKASNDTGPEWNIKATRGSTIGPWEISFFDKATGEPMDLSGYTLASQIRTAPLGSVAATLAFDLSQAAEGIVGVNVPYADTEALTGSSYVWNCTATANDESERLVLWRGTVTVLPGVTR